MGFDDEMMFWKKLTYFYCFLTIGMFTALMSTLEPEWIFLDMIYIFLAGGIICTIFHYISTRLEKDMLIN